MHHHATAASTTPTLLVIGGGLLLLFGCYLAAVAVSARRGRAWPWWRTGCAVAGIAAGVVAVGPLGALGHHDFAAHMYGHLLLGMLAPLLLVLSAPVTLFLRSLPVSWARRLSGVLGGRYLRVVGHPVAAATLDAGGLWLLYGTSLYGWMHASTTGHLVVHVHVLLAGWLFTAAILQVDPAPHPVSHWLRAGVLLVFLTAHSVLGKHVFANPPPGVARAQAEAGAQVMFYGGDYVDCGLIVAFCWDWYRRTAPRA